ncbi:hypothetical protein DICVIV_07382 [Dictyocaulus viviparus]|uniref:Uncharacterized protein n=1 Tax=Dictyocaulus viviparus TaxID=29172 RepID=A0A0D8XS29_DICVI|nr:hypothetical protein DICVIV_07382 [Dictyocaulus viviparus]
MSDGSRNRYGPTEIHELETLNSVLRKQRSGSVQILSTTDEYLTDIKGMPVGVASVHSHSRTAPQPSSNQPIVAAQSDTASPSTQIRSAHIIPLQQNAVSTPQQTVVDNASAPLAQPQVVQATQVVQKQNDNTFRFAQMGSGGQFTVSPLTDRVSSNSAPISKKSQDHVAISQASVVPSKYSVTNVIELNQSPTKLTTPGMPQTPLIVSFQPTVTTYQSAPQKYVPDCCGPKRLRFLQDSPRTADLAGDSPHMPNSGQSETVAETGDGTIENPITFDDPSSVLTPAALSMHEEMLRTQQKKIEVLLEELAKSQAHLKREQQLILTAKKAQFDSRNREMNVTIILYLTAYFLEYFPAAYTRTTTRERNKSGTRTVLRDLDVGHINKQHIQHFLQHKKHQSAVQRHSLEHNRLTTTEARLQEELHVEQAVQDIVRLIKQDPRTALLIVQLLRRYQLERNVTKKVLVGDVDRRSKRSLSLTESESNLQSFIRTWFQAEQQQTSSPDTAKVSQVNSPESTMAETLENTCQMSACNFDQKSNGVEDDQQSVVICDTPSVQVNHDRIFAYQQNNGLIPEEKSQSVDMEEIFKSVLEDATRAINNEATAAQSIDCTVKNNSEQSQQTAVICQQQWQQPIQLSEMEVEGSFLQSTNPPQQAATQFTVNVDADILQEPNAIMNNVQSYDQQTNSAGYSQDIDDLMAVLRDDQGISVLIFGLDVYMKPGSFQMDLGVGYGSEELADLLGEDWLDCADRSIANNGQYTPFENEQIDGVGGRNTDPMCLHPNSEENAGDQNMDWLDVMLQNTPIEQRPYESIPSLEMLVKKD